MNPFAAILFRDMRLATRAGGSAALALAFFAAVDGPYDLVVNGPRLGGDG